MMKAVRKADRNEIRLALKEYSKTGKFSEDICCTTGRWRNKVFQGKHYCTE